jgi:glycosyltransferase involved in cell wall biosynthesis
VSTSVENLLARTSDRIICISGDEHTEAVRAGIPADRLSLVHNGISRNRPSSSVIAASWPTTKTKVLFIGRLDRQKGYDLLLDAARSLEDRLDVRIVGAAVVGKYDGSKIPSNVSMLGWLARQQIEAQLDAADIIVIPSRWEGFGLVALEAMRAAKPILAFRIGALPEIVEDGVTGVLCTPVTSVQLADGFKRLLEMDLGVLGRRGYDRFKQLYDVEKTHRILRQVYIDVLEGDPACSKQQAELQSNLSNTL